MTDTPWTKFPLKPEAAALLQRIKQDKQAELERRYRTELAQLENNQKELALLEEARDEAKKHLELRNSAFTGAQTDVLARVQAGDLFGLAESCKLFSKMLGVQSKDEVFRLGLQFEAVAHNAFLQQKEPSALWKEKTTAKVTAFLQQVELQEKARWQNEILAKHRGGKRERGNVDELDVSDIHFPSAFSDTAQEFQRQLVATGYVFGQAPVVVIAQPGLNPSRLSKVFNSQKIGGYAILERQTVLGVRMNSGLPDAALRRLASETKVLFENSIELAPKKVTLLNSWQSTFGFSRHWLLMRDKANEVTIGLSASKPIGAIIGLDPVAARDFLALIAQHAKAILQRDVRIPVKGGQTVKFDEAQWDYVLTDETHRTFVGIRVKTPTTAEYLETLLEAMNVNYPGKNYSFVGGAKNWKGGVWQWAVSDKEMDLLRKCSNVPGTLKISNWSLAFSDYRAPKEQESTEPDPNDIYK